MNSELSRVKNEVQVQLLSFKDKIDEELLAVTEKCASVHGLSDSGHGRPDISKILVIRGLPFHEGENLNVKVNNLFKDVLKCSVQVCNTERKTSANHSKPGVVIATMQSFDDRQKVLKAKAKLRNSRNYSDVFIQCDQTREERLMMTNFRTVVGALKNSGITVRGNRVVHKLSNNGDQSLERVDNFNANNSNNSGSQNQGNSSAHSGTWKSRGL